MKIAIIHNKYKRSGGMESYMLDLVKGFAAQGDQVHIFSYVVDENLSTPQPYKIHRSSLNFLPRKIRKYAFILQQKRCFNRENFDISLSLTRTDCQDITVCGNTHLGYIDRMGHRSWWNKIFHDRVEAAFEKRAFEGAPHVMAHSKIVANEIKQYYLIEESKIDVIYPPIDTDKYKPISSNAINTVREKYNIKKDHINFLFPSMGHKHKGLLELLTAFARLDSRFHLYIVGQFVRHLPSNVHYLGYVENLVPLYAAVNYTILPSHYEAFGLVIPESLACGTPVIVTPQVGAMELLSKQDGIILSDNNPETIVDVIKNLPEKMLITENFAVKHALTIEDHISKIKSIG